MRGVEQVSDCYSEMTDWRAIKSLLQTMQIKDIELGLDMASQDVEINIDWVKNELWKERRELITEGVLKALQREFAKGAKSAPQQSGITASYIDEGGNRNLTAPKTIAPYAESAIPIATDMNFGSGGGNGNAPDSESDTCGSG